METAETKFKNRLEFKGAVVGMCLGDGHIRIPKGGKEAQFSITHCRKQVDYMLYKVKILEYLTSCWVKEGITVLNGKDFANIKMQTKSHPFYTKLMDHLYFDGRRTVDEHVMKCLTPMGLALWYQDDGCLANNDNFLTPFIYTYAYSKTEVEMMSRMLQKMFGLQWRCNRQGKYYALRLRRSDREAFYELIKPYIQPCMEYKIEDDNKRPRKDRGESVTLKCQHCHEQFSVDYKVRKIRKYCGSKCYHDSRLKEREESCA